MKKFLTLMLTAVMAVACCFGLTACNEKSDVKIGLICLHGETSTYDKNFIDAMKAACEAKGADLVIKTDIAESDKCYEAAIDLVSQGCTAIFADSFGHEPYILKAAKEKPDVQFYHATGTTAHTENVANFHNAFANIYEGRYLAGVAAGLKLNEMISNQVKINGTVVTAENAMIGYVGAFTYAEVMSGYTSFYLGAKSVCPTVKMKVTFTGSWYDEVKEKSAAENLISKGCNLISQHADSWGAPTACEEARVPNVSYNGSTESKCPNTFIISSRINWQPYYELIIDAARGGEKVPTDWTASFGNLYTAKNGSVCVTELGKTAPAKGTAEILDKLVYRMKYDPSFKVFDCNTFTVKGEKLTSYMADVNTDKDYTPDTEVIKTITVGEKTITYFAESEFRSAPYFNVEIDGIELLDKNYGA